MRRWLPLGVATGLALSLSACATVPDVAGGGKARQIIVSVADQKMTVVRDGGGRVTYPVSTSKFGLNAGRRSYTTPTGTLAIAQKVGGGAPAGAVFHGRVRTGEIVKVNSPGRDPIVTRILALRGLESGNSDALSRGIYIHGTPEENLIGTPASYGCIRMRSRDVIALYEMVDVGTRVRIIDSTQRGAVAASGVDLTPPRPAAAPASAPSTTLVASNDSATAEPTAEATPASAPATRASRPAAVQVVTAAPTSPTNPKWAGSPGKLLAEKPVPPPVPTTTVVAQASPRRAAPPAPRPAAGTRPVVNATESPVVEPSRPNTRTLRSAALDSL